jgi:hypothetical protein
MRACCFCSTTDELWRHLQQLGMQREGDALGGGGGGSCLGQPPAKVLEHMERAK